MDDIFNAGDKENNLRLFVDAEGLKLVCQSIKSPEPLKWFIKKIPLDFLDAAECIQRFRTRERIFRFEVPEEQLRGQFSYLPNGTSPRSDQFLLKFVLNDTYVFETKIRRFCMADLIVRIQDHFRGPTYTMENCTMSPIRGSVAVD